MEVSALNRAGAAGIHGRSPLLRLQSDERLVALVRRGNQHAFEALVARYQSRLLAFCRHMLASKEDAEDVLQDVFAAAFNAMLADDREINVRPWLYRIARNRSLNHLRRAQAVGVDSMDVHLAEGGLSTADKVHKREEFRLLIGDVQDLPETQRTALLLREIDALSYDQIAEAMETTVPSVKSLLVRARVSLAEAAEARLLSCDEVRLELGQVAEGLSRTTAPVRRHLRTCDQCQTFRKHLRQTNKALAVIFPVGPLLLTKKLLLAHLGTTAAAGGGAAAATTGGAAAAGAAAGGVLQAGMGAIATKAAAGLAAAAIVTAGAVEVKHVAVDAPKDRGRSAQVVAAAPAAAAQPAAAAPAPVAVRATPQPSAVVPAEPVKPAERETVAETEVKKPEPAAAAPSDPATDPVGVGDDGAIPVAEVVGPESQTDSDTTVLPTDTAATTEPSDGALGPQKSPGPAPGHSAQPSPGPAQPGPAASPQPGPAAAEPAPAEPAPAEPAPAEPAPAEPAPVLPLPVP